MKRNGHAMVLVLLTMVTAVAPAFPMDALPEGSEPQGLAAEHQLPLQVPLYTTAPARQRFLKELKGRDGAARRQLYEQWIDRIGANGIVEALDRAHPDCHELGHELGRVLYSRIGNIGVAVQTCQGVCNSGCMHGVFAEALTREPGSKGTTSGMATLDPKQIAARSEAICATGRDYSVGDCLHGLGHGFLAFEGYNLDKALAFCDELTPYARAYYCATGVYMELFVNPPAGYLDGKPVYFPCDHVAYPAACFRYRLPSAQQEFVNSGGRFADLVAGCEALQGRYRVGCFHGVGNAMSLYLRRGRSLGEVCGHGDRDDQYACVDGAIERLARYSPHAAEQACSEASGWHREVCDEARGRQMYAMDKPFGRYPR